MQIEKLYHLRHFSLDYEKWIFKIFVFLSFFQALSCQVPYNLRKTSICCCILTHIFFWLNTEDNAELYIIKSLNLSSTRKCYNEPQGTLFLWFGLILFLPHQSNVIDHSWPVAMSHICKNKKLCLYVHEKTFQAF